MTESNSCCFCFGTSRRDNAEPRPSKTQKKDASMLLAFERRDELEQNAVQARGLVNETTLVMDDSLMKSNISASRLFMDSR